MCDTLKNCIKCNKNKNENEFPFRFKHLNERHNICKECKKNQEQIRRDEHREEINKKLLDIRRPQRRKLNEINRIYQNDPKNKIKINARKKIRKMEIKDLAKNGDKHCIQIIAKRLLRDRINKAISTGFTNKAFKSVELLGASWEVCIQWLEKQFKPGMNWSNHGLNGWHIDHIRPCASFDLTDPLQQKQCFHYTNLQPLWADENLKKGSSWLTSPASHDGCGRSDASPDDPCGYGWSEAAPNHGSSCEGSGRR